MNLFYCLGLNKSRLSLNYSGCNIYFLSVYFNIINLGELVYFMLFFDYNY